MLEADLENTKRRIGRTARNDGAAEHLLMAAPEVLGVAMVLPAPVSVAGGDGKSAVRAE